jgi:cysteinyl-tRNA synthetase
MTMQLYNTLTRSLMKVQPIHQGKINLYACGPTVYGYAHIGNLRKFIFDDTLRRTLKAAGYEVKQVMNITDVGHLVSDGDDGDDKLETGAKREGKSVWEVAMAYTDAFKDDMKQINVLPPNGYHDTKANDTYARATNFIEQQLELVQLLLDHGHAYQTEQAIYFDVTTIPDYGELTGQALDQKEVGVRSEVVTDTHKHHPSDFAVWFFTVGHFAGHTMRWPSPWGEGFPGWHLECSAIIHTVLGDPIDIHTGGVDHIGTHHPNEMAQTQAAFGHHLANIWAHSEFVLVDGTKMSKSKGNTYTLADITKRDYSPMAFRLLVMQAHYRSELNFTWASLRAANNSLLNLYAWADQLHQPAMLSVKDNGGIDRRLANIQASLEDDLDTPGALAQVYDLVGQKLSKSELETATAKLDLLFGLGLSGRDNITSRQKELINEREDARLSENWKLSDQLRDKLTKDRLNIEDTPNGPRWRRMSL